MSDTYIVIANTIQVRTNIYGPMNIIAKLREIAGKKMPLVRQIVPGDGRDRYAIVVFDKSVEQYKDALNKKAE